MHIRGVCGICVCVGSIANCAVCDSHTLFDTLSLSVSIRYCGDSVALELFMLPLFLLLFIGWNYFHITPGMAATVRTW